MRGAPRSCPALYGSLYFVFARLLNETDPQATPSVQIENYELALKLPILDLLVDDIEPAMFRERLGEVMRNALAVLK